MRRIAGLAVLVVVAILAVAGYAVYQAAHAPDHPSATPSGCTAKAAGKTVWLTVSQAENAAVITTVAVRRQLPARAVSIALTAAWQESGMENLPYGDSDSLGLFQQRPSMGWGSPTEVMNPTHAANAFYDALERIPGYETMDIATAAQEVQRSAYPMAYRQHEEASRVLASALTGNSAAAFSCVVDDPSLSPQRPADGGLTRRALAAQAAVRAAYAGLPVRPVAATFVGESPGPDAAVARSTTFDVELSPGPGARVRGWSVAQYLVANAERLHIRRIAFAGHVWRAGDASQSRWAHARPGGTSPGRVHVVVW